MRIYSSLVLTLPFALYSSVVLSNTLQQSPNNFDFSFREGNHLNLNVGAEYGHTDNFFYQQENQSSSSYNKLFLDGFLQAHTDQHLIQLSGVSNTLFFDEFSEDDHSDVSLRGKYFYKISDEHTLFSSGSFRQIFEYRGTGLTKGDPLSADKGDKLDNMLFNLGYRYGGFDSVSKLSALLGKTKLGYKTRKDVTKVLDYSSTFAHLSLDYLLSGKTYFSVATEYENIAYDNVVAQDRDEIAALAGIKWEASQLSQLTLLLGYESISFNKSLLEDRDTFKWRVSYDWTPADQFKIQFESGRDTDKSNSTLTNYVLKDSYSLNATYAFSMYTSFIFGVSFYDEETNFVEGTENEQYFSFNGRYSYMFNRWLSIYAKALFETKNSELSINEYDKRTLSMGIIGIF